MYEHGKIRELWDRSSMNHLSLNKTNKENYDPKNRRSNIKNTVEWICERVTDSHLADTNNVFCQTDKN